MISFRIDGLDLLAVQGTLKSLLQHHTSKASILQCSAFLWSNSHIHPGINMVIIYNNNVPVMYMLHVLRCSVTSSSLQPMDSSPTGSSVHGIFPGKNIGVDCHFFLQGIFLIQRWNPHFLPLLCWQVDSLPLSHHALCKFV